jgi:chromosome segregation ATPase
MTHRIAALSADADALKHERSMLHAELAKAITELDLSGKVVSHLGDAQSKLDAELSSLRVLQVDSSRINTELLSAIETLRNDREAFATQRDDHERELRGTIADLQQRLELAVADHTKSRATGDSKIAGLEAKLARESERLKSFPSRYEGGEQLVSARGCLTLSSYCLTASRPDSSRILIARAKKSAQLYS